MKKAGFSRRFKYRFDNLMSKGTGVLIGVLALVTIFIIFLVSLFVAVTQSSPGTSLFRLMWKSFNRALDAGALEGDSGSFLFILSMFIMTVSGIFILSMLIGLLNSGIQKKLESLRKGRSRVLENNHTVILGWSEHIFTILSELIEANSNHKKSCIVILGDRDKVEMDDAIKERIGDFKTTRIVTRQGNPIDIGDLDIVSLNTAKSVIILEQNDSNVIKTILAITNNPDRSEGKCHIVATMKNLKNIEVARIAAGNQVEIISTNNLVARIMAQTCRQPGLSSVYTELLDFGGDEIYFSDCPALYGKTFGEALFMFEKSAVIGISAKGKTCVNPPMDTIIREGDRIIAISEDDDTVIPSRESHTVYRESIKERPENNEGAIEKTLLLGWNELALDLVRELDSYVRKDSLITIVSDNISEEQHRRVSEQTLNQQVEFITESTEDRNVLDALASKGYNHVIILSNGGRDIQEADSSTLITLLHLRDIAEKTGVKFSIVSEILDSRNKKLAEVAKVNDFIVSEKLISLILSQVSENRSLNAVFEDLFDADGSEIYIKPSSNYVKSQSKINFHTVVESARQRNEAAIGYIVASERNDPGYGIHINPPKSDMITMSDHDSIIVISED